MSELFKMTIANWPAMLKGLVDAKHNQLTYMRTELKRSANRIKKTFIREQLQGPPGIRAPVLSKGKNVWTHVQGDNPKRLVGSVGISRILHVHEAGLTIPAKNAAGLLYLRRIKQGKGQGPIGGVVPSVTIPKRLKFKQLVAREAPKELRKVGEAGSRGIEVALTKALKKSL